MGFKVDVENDSEFLSMIIAECTNNPEINYKENIVSHITQSTDAETL